MLRLIDLVKIYQTKDLKVEALKGVSLNFRKSEFVAILGPSGCGKTTMLNILGGLDHYTDGDLVINGISTKNFSSHDWDVYRNHRIGFVFQSYNLIPHQNILENVELSLTISGLSKKERVAKAEAALDRVGLAGMYKKLPNQLSGGQCQRVAIARALVNEPDILLADEPTGALDSKTSVQIMDLIKEISKDKLVIMVTHNDDLAKTYATRIVSLKDGEIVGDTNPFSDEDEAIETASLTPIDPSKEKAKMSFWTAFKLSGRNLWTKFKRTALITVASSIGIVGVATVLAISSGMTNYIDSQEDDMLSGYPITIAESGYDFSAILDMMDSSSASSALIESAKDGYINVDFLIEYLIQSANSAEDLLVSNEITEDYVKFVKDMDEDDYAAMNISYGIDVKNNIYTDMTMTRYDESTKVISEESGTYSVSGITSICKSMLETSELLANYASYLDQMVTVFDQAVPESEYVLNQYDVVATRDEKDPFPTAENEIMIVLDHNDMISDLILTELGYYSQAEFTDLVYYFLNEAGLAEKGWVIPDASDLKTSFSEEELLNKTFTYYPNDTVYDEISVMTTEETSLVYPAKEYHFQEEDSFSGGEQLIVKSILTPKDGINYGCLSSGLYFTEAFANKFIAEGQNSQIVGAMNDSGLTSVYSGSYSLPTGLSLDYGITYTYDYYFDGANHTAKAYLGTSSSSVSYITLRQLGGMDTPSSIEIYPNDFNSKYLVTEYLDKWNAEGDITLSDGSVIAASSREEITYVDNLDVIITMINSIINIITYALVAFTSLSLVVSTVMIGIITYVSVMERIKEIGVIRALGGRKQDVARLFNAETAIIGLASGVFGIAVTYILQIIINIVIGSLSGIYTIAGLPWTTALICIGVSIALTLISGLIPASSAARKDPVEALRTE